ncbi:MAG: TlpA disulfide reductase family protein [Cyclobacteriaceae bacterium]
MKYLFAIFCIVTIVHIHAQTLKNGDWRGVITYEKGEIPFLFEIAPSGSDVPEITFTNGKERRKITNATIKGDSIYIPMEPFDVTLKAAFTAMSMNGTYEKHYRDASMPFSASFGGLRFTKNSTRPSGKIEKRWKIVFSPESSSMSDGVGLFEQIGDKVTGTIMTETSDYRFFEGILDGDSLKLSSFDGAHAFAFLGVKTTADSWEGEMIYDNTYAESWKATYDAKADLGDPFEVVKPEKGVHKPYYDLLGAGSGQNSIDPSKYAGKVLIIQLFGTWCPNSHDQTTYLVDWYNKNKEKNVAILASSYEANYSKEYGLSRLDTYQKINKIPYDLVLGGRLSKTGAATAIPFIEKLKAFPTLIILDKEGYARYVHSYFNGPATGQYYTVFDDRFNQIINELTAE